MLMAEMGARVIKVEPPKGGDDARAYGPYINGKSTYFASVNRGKQSIALDLKADVLVENFRPGTMEKLGFGWEQLHPKFPKLIYAAASGFGHTGPNSKDPAYDMVVQGMGGVMSAPVLRARQCLRERLAPRRIQVNQSEHALFCRMACVAGW